MSKFLTGTALEETIYNIIWDTQEVLLIVSPYIKLDEYFKKLFDKHNNNPKIHLILVFGKNEKEVRRSMSQGDFEYFKNFPKVSIIYVPNLHAKYYGNEKQGVVTSINLYDYSFKNNVEFGVFSQQGIFDKFANNPDHDAWTESMRIAETNEVVFIKRPVFEHKKLIVSFGKNYIKSDVLLDCTEKFYGRKNKKIDNVLKLKDFPQELELGKNLSARPQRQKDVEFVTALFKKHNKTQTSKVIQINDLYSNKVSSYHGHCLRCSEKIKFSTEKPYCYSCFSTWSQFENPDYEEKYCHSCGNAQVSTLNKPECYSCYKKKTKKKAFQF